MDEIHKKGFTVVIIVLLVIVIGIHFDNKRIEKNNKILSQRAETICEKIDLEVLSIIKTPSYNKEDYVICYNKLNSKTKKIPIQNV